MARSVLSVSSCLCGLGLLSSAIASARTLAADEIMLGSGADLVDACREQVSDEANAFCGAYLLGYVDAHPKVVFNEELPSAYMQRALRTQAPSHPHTNVTKKAVYCLENEETLVEISDTISLIDLKTAADVAPATLIENILKQQYRCRL